VLVHLLDQQIKKARADGRINRSVRIRFLAYADVIEPPSRPLPGGFDYETCVATFFPIRRCYVHNINQRDCQRNAEYMQQLYGWTSDPRRHYRGQMCIGEATATFGTVGTSRRVDPKWKGRWHSAVQETAEGWAAEVALPIETLTESGMDLA